MKHFFTRVEHTWSFFSFWRLANETTCQPCSNRIKINGSKILNLLNQSFKPVEHSLHIHSVETSISSAHCKWNVPWQDLQRAEASVEKTSLSQSLQWVSSRTETITWKKWNGTLLSQPQHIPVRIREKKLQLVVKSFGRIWEK